MPTALLNFVLFQLGWFSLVVSGAHGYPWSGSLLAVGIIAWHLWRAAPRVAELKLIGMAMLIGVIFDSVLVWQGWLSYPSGMVMPFLAPYWMIILWALFATTLNISLRWLKERWVIAALLGAIGGPIAYLGGQQLGAVQFVNQSAALIALLIGWAVLTPLLVALSRYYDGYTLLEVRQ